ncbi:MAG: hypothetical protein HY591_06035 [Candidatus Omnitrophica bacterium]|nr:hypothetical protein [Candidatus Omnitrophota bacterium]
MSPGKGINALGSQIVREIIIPALTKEINTGKNFTQLRQVYNSLILAIWYKKKIKDSILAQVYADKNKIAGVQFHRDAINGVSTPEEIYQCYLKAFKKGAYNYIKEEFDPMTRQIIPRKYFSGGMDFAMVVGPEGMRGLAHLLKEESNPMATVGTPDSAMKIEVEIIAMSTINNSASPYGGYKDFFQIWMQDLVKSPRNGTIPFFLIGGYMGGGKTTMSKLFKQFLEDHGHAAVVVHTDRFVNNRNLLLKQIVRNPANALLYINLPWRGKYHKKQIANFNRIHINEQNRNKFWQQLESLKIPQGHEVELHISPKETVTVRAGTVIIIEGVFTKNMFPLLRPIKSVFININPLLQRMRIIKRIMAVRGNSFLYANIKARMAGARIWHTLLSQEIDQYDYLINVDNNKRITMSTGNPGDSAMIAFGPEGGIDLASGRVLKVNKDGDEKVKFHIDRAMLRRLQNAPGFAPRITGMRPVTDLRRFLTVPGDLFSG